MILDDLGQSPQAQLAKEITNRVLTGWVLDTLLLRQRGHVGVRKVPTAKAWMAGHTPLAAPPSARRQAA